MQAVAPEQPPGAHPRGGHAVRVLREVADPGGVPLGARGGGPVREGRVQHGAAHAAPGRPGEPVLGALVVPHVGDARERASGGVDVPAPQQVDGPRHQALAARLVDGRPARLDDERRQPGAARLEGRGEPDRPAADDQDVDVRGGAHRPGAGTGPPPPVAAASARSSAGIRNPSSSTALSTVNASAVTQAVCTSGSAMPSTTTAT